VCVALDGKPALPVSWLIDAGIPLDYLLIFILFTEALLLFSLVLTPSHVTLATPFVVVFVFVYTKLIKVVLGITNPTEVNAQSLFGCRTLFCLCFYLFGYKWRASRKPYI